MFYRLPPSPDQFNAISTQNKVRALIAVAFVTVSVADEHSDAGGGVAVRLIVADEEPGLTRHTARRCWLLLAHYLAVVDGTGSGVYTGVVKLVGNRIAETPVEYYRQGARLYASLERWNPYPRPRGKVFKFRTWEDLEKWRQSQTNPRLR